VTSTSPVDCATGVKSDSLVLASFSDAMNKNTKYIVTFIVKNDGDANPITGMVISPDGRTVVLNSTKDFDSNTKYIVAIDIKKQDSAERDLAGKELVSAKRWMFTT
jgi:hypothetical protein